MGPRRFVAVASAAVLLVAGAAVAGAVGQDPGLPQQWGMAKIGAPSAWARSVGAGVPVAIVDTGVDLGHDDLKDQIMARVTCVDTGGDRNKCVVDGADVEGHGTHVAGIAAAASNNVGVAGVAPGARIVAVRVFGSKPDPVTEEYTAKSSDIEAGIHWVIANIATKGAINLSLGGDFVVTNVEGGASFAAAVEDAWKAGWVTVLASGNDNLFVLGSQNYGSMNALVVGATGPGDKPAYYSSPTGDAKWALVAPGGEDDGGDCTAATCILSTYRGNGYAASEGTSMATPHVTGAVALLMSGGMTNAQAVQRILDTADRRVVCNDHCVGRLDVNKAVPADWKVSGSSTGTTAPSGGGGGSATTVAAGSGGTSATTARSTSSGSGGTSSSKPRAGSSSTVVVASPEQLAAPTDTVADTTTTAPPSSSDEGGSDAAAPPSDSTSDDDGPSTALVALALALTLAAGTGAGIAVRRLRRARGV